MNIILVHQYIDGALPTMYAKQIANKKLFKLLGISIRNLRNIFHFIIINAKKQNIIHVPINNQQWFDSVRVCQNQTGKKSTHETI